MALVKILRIFGISKALPLSAIDRLGIRKTRIMLEIRLSGGDSLEYSEDFTELLLDGTYQFRVGIKLRQRSNRKLRTNFVIE